MHVQEVMSGVLALLILSLSPKRGDYKETGEHPSLGSLQEKTSGTGSIFMHGIPGCFITKEAFLTTTELASSHLACSLSM